MSRYDKTHMAAAMDVLQYAHNTKEYGLYYGSGVDIELKGFFHGYWPGDILDSKCTTGYIFSLGQDIASPLTWKSKKQPVKTTSLAESELMAGSDACKEGSWLRYLLDGMGYKQKHATPLGIEERAIIEITEDPSLSVRQKHIDIKFHYMRECILEKKMFSLSKINLDKQAAKFLTSALCQQDFNICLKLNAIGPASNHTPRS